MLLFVVMVIIKHSVLIKKASTSSLQQLQKEEYPNVNVSNAVCKLCLLPKPIPKGTKSSTVILGIKLNWWLTYLRMASFMKFVECFFLQMCRCRQQPEYQFAAFDARWRLTRNSIIAGMKRISVLSMLWHVASKASLDSHWNLGSLTQTPEFTLLPAMFSAASKANKSPVCHWYLCTPPA